MKINHIKKLIIANIIVFILYIIFNIVLLAIIKTMNNIDFIDFAWQYIKNQFWIVLLMLVLMIIGISDYYKKQQKV
ncbi:hypothetical protein QV02_08090 [Gallibacterium anatis]|uniref:Uncharacterized protein n=1 Tax=Gallibacterium genomosp. 3 TaxID=505345 RepID=A0A1A7Q097_9PAST|nr:hypothetical protein QV02_08090 [Gallibacterium anatis]OBX07362.1 hypothetical protein QV07_07000 [Gallibacterium genomosp. 3]